MHPKRAHYVNMLVEAVKAFNSHGLAKTSMQDRKFIRDEAESTAECAEDETVLFDFGICHWFFDYITARTKVVARVSWVDYVEPAPVEPVRERAIAEWRKVYDPRGEGIGQWRVRVSKSRRRKTITVTRDVPWHTVATMTFSYEGGNLRQV